MAQDHLIFHTNDRVVTSTSLGNQEKWFDAEKNLWYKVDNGHFEALAEAMASEVLRRFTNAADLPGISIAHYWVDTADVHGLPQVLSVSENFKAGNESLITAHTILRNSLGRGYIQEFRETYTSQLMKPHKAPFGLCFRLPANIGKRFLVNLCKHSIG